ncbi:iron-siderophore ABC transporter substrate-binding protein [Cyanobacterium stanieri LEGE 03274]|uniref:Iron-siderophore ABC transporter substrate-binding protein n=1 Tax=Cyanobacterium stanieri LEGE 03274 TaxID=1828756 RepID=A0ABR9V3U0_9CHRO|nr:iron-siderophore ABC transporter substrate-binding protein [Cyanobacterium stanieri]MBE9222568.1 iron-siderophore ABC transporter substrate-binding protein [Cyanobacterium stanieri LEGE 03274]
MRYLSIIFSVLFFSVGVVGCDNPSVSESRQESSLTDGENGRLISHAMGETQINGTPERVVILTNEGTDILLALGVQPVGAVKSWQGDPFYDYIEGEMTGVEVIGDEFQPSLELIVSLQPDLIIGSKVRQEQLYSQLSAIAPTVFSETIGVSWRENLELYAIALNRQEKAEELLTDWDQRVTEFKNRLGDNAPTVSLVRFLADNTRLYYRNSFPGQIVEEVGLKRPPEQQKDDFADQIAIENIELLDADYLFYFTYDVEGENGEAVKQRWLSHPLWQTLDVAKNDRTYQVSDVHWTTSSGILAAHKILDDLERTLY